MSQWLDRVDDLLYDGEAVESRVDVGAGGVVVTSHRVLAFTPERDGPNFEHVDRPNVDDVDRTARGEAAVIAPAVKALVVGGVLLAAGQIVSLDGVVESVDLSSTGRLGLGGMLATLQSLLNVLAMLDEAMTVLGALGLLVGAALLGVYARTREELLVVEVADDDDLELPLGDGGDDIADGLERAVRPDGAQTAGESAGPGRDLAE